MRKDRALLVWEELEGRGTVVGLVVGTGVDGTGVGSGVGSGVGILGPSPLVRVL